MANDATRRLLILLATCAICCPTAGQELSPTLETAARRLVEATVTVRLRYRLPEPSGEASPEDGLSGEDDASPPDSLAADAVRPGVSVCTGVVVGPRLVVTPTFGRSLTEVRITLADGDQTAAELRVLDQYSGLALLQTATPLAGSLAPAANLPPVGSWVLSAAGWGTEQPAVSVGILGANQRILPGTSYPPLLQCDLRTAGTSGGAAVVDRQARLIGIVVAVDAQPDRRGWTYAVPAGHVQRLLAAAANEDAKVVILKRQRPVIGMVLDGRADQVHVSRVAEGSPAQRAGIRSGDRVLTADGIRIRSVYQAVRPLLYKQPGDKMVFLLERGSEQLTAEVLLGGGGELPPTPDLLPGQYVRPSVDVRRIGDGFYTDEGSRHTDSAPSGQLAAADRPETSAGEKVRRLEELVRTLQQQLEELQQQLKEQP